MDTPDRNPIGTPVSNIQESPFSNFINNLSPINPPKSIHISQTIGSLSFTSPPSVFTSPHVSLQKDCKFLRRFQVSDQAKSPLAFNEGSKDSVARNNTNAEQHSDALARGEGASAGESSDTPLEDSSECAAEQQRVLTYDNGNPHHKSKTENSSDKDTQCEADTSLALVPVVKNPSERNSFGTSLNLRNINHDNEDAGCDWLSLITCNSDLFIFDSPDVNATSKDPSHKSQEETHDNAYDKENLLQIDSGEYTKANESTENSTQPMEEIESLQIDQPSGNPDISSVNEFLSHDTGEKPGKEAIVNLHRGMLRRCLTFEIPRTKKSIEELSGSRQPVTPTGDSRRCILPSIGLHLNALAATSKDCSILNQNILSPTTQDPIINSSSSLPSRKDEGQAENVLESAEDPSQASLYASNEELKTDSPKKKRKKAETIEEGDSCKRCNCKKSKCLKLYCECFAAGIYCIEPCSCQDCFNKPIHEDIVLATRKQIESRNPLAFAPKVIRTESTQEIRDDSNQTPASARHKRGCNCKKSNCLKKYCECYQGGVGCSINCRCEGCKNAFGIKDGSILMATQPEMHKLQALEKSIIDRTSVTSEFHDDDEQNSEFTIPKTPSRLYRSSIPLATSSKGKPPRSSIGKINSSSSLLPTDGIGRSTFLRTQSGIEKRNQNVSFDDIPELLQNMSPPSSGLKTLSPNSKRISSPHHDNGQAIGLSSSRKLILRSIPSFPSLSPRH